MKRLQSILFAALLILSISAAAFGGQISGRAGQISGAPAPVTIAGQISGLLAPVVLYILVP
jgi:hypothetical protein